MVSFIEAAKVLFDRGWTTVALRPDANGIPKIPITQGWSNLSHDWEAIASQRWEQAQGIGIVLGAASDNLAVLDLDDVELMDITVAMQGFSEAYRMVRTARNRGHIYFTELDGATNSTWREVEYQGRRIKIELKTEGTQVAAPPSPGYRLLTSGPPQDCFSIQAAFEFLLDCLEDYIPGQVVLAASVEGQPVGAGYPKPWSAQVPESERNKTAYMEAHKLREAGTPVEVALRLMQARFQQDYAKGGITWHEIEATVRSAYRKGEVVDRPLSSWGDETRLLV